MNILCLSSGSLAQTITHTPTQLTKFFEVCQKSSFSAFAFTFLTFQTFQAFHEIFLNVNKPKAFSALGLFGTLVSIIHATFL